jgi:hypothetical protein
MNMTTRDWLRRPGIAPGRPARLWNWNWNWNGSGNGTRHRQGPPRRRQAPELLALERRELLTVVPKQFPLFVSPSVLPPDNKFHTVSFTGAVASTRPQVPTGFFQVTDEYRQYEPAGPVALTPIGQHKGFYDFQFKFTLTFPAQRSTNTPDGRHFDVLIGARDGDNTDGRTVAVFVPKTYPPPQTGKPIVAGPTVKTTLARRR